MTPILHPDIQTETAAHANPQPSRFSWYELHTPDATAAAAFYKPVLGWSSRDAGDLMRNYTIVSVGETPIGGLLEKPPAAFASGDKARWIGYVGVHDVHLLSKQVQQAGGTVHRSAEEIPGVGTFAVVADPQGAIFVLFQPLPGITPPVQPSLSTEGMPVWHDLAAPDWPSAFQFYSALFGWTKGQAVQMGPNSVYQIFAAGSQDIGGMMTMPDTAQSAGWMFYFYVDEVNAAIARVKQNGGTVVHGPSPVPGGQQIAHCLDTQGAIFGLVGPATRSHSNTACF